MVEGPKFWRKEEARLEQVVEVSTLRVGQKVLIYDDFASDSLKPMWLNKGEIGTVTSLTSEGGALILFAGKDKGGRSLSTIVKKKNFDKLRVEAPKAAAPAKRPSRPEAAAASAPRKVVACGDVGGNVDKLFTTIATQTAKVGAFDAALCVGSFFPQPGAGADAAKCELGSSLAPYLRGEKKAPVQTFFIDDDPVLLQTAPDGRQICDGLQFLGGYGVRDVSGLRVAFLSGRYDEELFHTPNADFVGGAFTQSACESLQRLVLEDPRRRGVDVLLTCGWPAELEQHLLDEASKPLDPDDTRPSWRSACAPPLRELCFALEPRYHLFGTADLFYQRPPFTVPKRGHACRCIGLGRVGSAGKQRKWLHALSLSPMEKMRREDMIQAAPNSTPCPFAGAADCSRKRANGAAEEEGSSAKRRRVQANAARDVPLREQATEALQVGDIVGLQRLAGELRESVLERRERPAATTAPLAATGAAPGGGDSAQRLQPASSPGTGEPVPSPAAEGEPPSPKREARVSEEELKAKEQEEARKLAAQEWLAKRPAEGVVRFTFKEDGPLGLRLSKDVPPWILEVKDGSLAARKAPRVPVAGIVIAVNGHEVTEKQSQDVMLALKRRPVVLDVEWPVDQVMPSVCRA